jgi:hypothetical protein
VKGKPEMKKVYLYGAGGYGRSALGAFIESGNIDMIAAVIDNNPGFKQATVYGKPIIPYIEARRHFDSNVTVLITVELETSLTISEQLKKDGYIRYVYWAHEQYRPIEDLVRILQEEDDYKVFCHSLLQENSTISNQRDYLLDMCNPLYMKKARGALRTRQLRLVKFAKEVATICEKIDTHPFLSSGNLFIVRHIKRSFERQINRCRIAV